MTQHKLKKNSRSHRYFKQVKLSAVMQIGVIGVNFLTMPVMVKYLGPELFGVWAVMLSFLSWIMLMDFGIGNGLKNHITQEIAHGHINAAKSYISTAYFLRGTICIFLFVIFLLFHFSIDWSGLFNYSTEPNALNYATFYFFIYLIVNFWLSIVTQIFHGLQRSSVVVFSQLLSNTLSLISVSLLYLFTEQNILYLIHAYGFSLITTNVVLTLFLAVKNHNLLPDIKAVSFVGNKTLLTLSLKFFTIQIAAMVLFTTDKILISRYLGPSFVTEYTVIFKLFSIFTVFHSLLLVPLWPAYAEAHAHNDIQWIKNKIKSQIKIVSIIILLAIILAIISPWIIKIWMLEQIKVHMYTTWLMVLFITVTTWNNIFAYYQNAVNDINLQYYFAFVIPFLNIILSVYFLKNGQGIAGVILATIISLSSYAIIGPIQVYNKIFSKSLKKL